MAVMDPPSQECFSGYDATRAVTRPQLVAAIVKDLYDEPAVTLSAPAGFGKSWLLAQTVQALRQGPGPIESIAYIDVALLASDTRPAAANGLVVKLLIEALQNALGPQHFLGPQERLHAMVTSYLKKFSGQRLLLILDGADQVMGQPGWPDYLSQLRSLLDRTSRDELLVLLTTRSSFEMLDASAAQLSSGGVVAGSPFNVSRFLNIPEFTVEQAREMGQKLGAGPEHFDLPEVVQRVGGAPGLLAAAFSPEGPGLLAQPELLSFFNREPAQLLRLIQVREYEPTATHNTLLDYVPLAQRGLIVKRQNKWVLRAPIYSQWIPLLLEKFEAPEALSSDRLQTRGSLGEDVVYVRRRADLDLLIHLLQQDFCYVIAPRQIGKSSLRMRTERLLARFGIRCATIDLQMLGSLSNEDAFYSSFCEELADTLRINVAVKEFFAARAHLSAGLCLYRFIVEVILEKISEEVVLFVDEIDAMLGASFNRDGFFSAFRSLYARRAREPSLRRFTVCLIGAASPQELVHDPLSTPFADAIPIAVEDFSRVEVQAFLPALSGHDIAPERLLDAVYEWTAGHPYMTSCLCKDLNAQVEWAGRSLPLTAAQRVESAVQARFFKEQDPNLIYAEKRFRALQDRSVLAQGMRRVHRALLAGTVIPLDESSAVQTELRLCGMVSRQRSADGRWVLTLRNRIFAQAFDSRWLRQIHSDSPLTVDLEIWLESRSNIHLLRGSKLDAALRYAREQADLSLEELQFISLSMEKAQGELQSRLKLTRRVIIAVSMVAFFTVISTFVIDLNLAKDQKRIKLELETLTSRTVDATSIIDKQNHDMQSLYSRINNLNQSENDLKLMQMRIRNEISEKERTLTEKAQIIDQLQKIYPNLQEMFRLQNDYQNRSVDLTAALDTQLARKAKLIQLEQEVKYAELQKEHTLLVTTSTNLERLRITVPKELAALQRQHGEASEEVININKKFFYGYKLTQEVKSTISDGKNVSFIGLRNTLNDEDFLDLDDRDEMIRKILAEFNQQQCKEIEKLKSGACDLPAPFIRDSNDKLDKFYRSLNLLRDKYTTASSNNRQLLEALKAELKRTDADIAARKEALIEFDGAMTKQRAQMELFMRKLLGPNRAAGAPFVPATPPKQKLNKGAATVTRAPAAQGSSSPPTGTSRRTK